MPLKPVVLALLFVAMPAAAASRRLALLIGIDDYSASRLTAIREPAPNRDWPNLSGAVNDTAALRELLVLLRGFDERGVVALNDQAATRSAILAAMSGLATTAAKDDIVFFYFAGHGSQVRNSRSDEI
ncbi:MAG TPA: caspase family protein, partial [Thermoanaerobaculia bacterium]|nr:caspase family protein [Thermoanaerobaculia bacterium]